MTLIIGSPKEDKDIYLWLEKDGDDVVLLSRRGNTGTLSYEVVISNGKIRFGVAGSNFEQLEKGHTR